MKPIKLNNGEKIPNIGFGTWQIWLNGSAKKAVSEALKIGYRLIDTARIYGNEKGVGAAIRDSGLKRKDIFVTTKLWNNSHGYDEALKAFDKSLERLKLDHVDLYLIHWPAGGKLKETWQAMEAIYKSGRAKSIGVSNYDAELLQQMLSYQKIPPAVNQVEFHPFIYDQQSETVKFCQKNNIVVEAYSPLNQGHGLNHPTILDIALKHHKTPAQIMIRWTLQHGTIPIPKSSHPKRMQENFEVFNFELSADNMQDINNISTV